MDATLLSASVYGRTCSTVNNNGDVQVVDSQFLRFWLSDKLFFLDERVRFINILSFGLYKSISYVTLHSLFGE